MSAGGTGHAEAVQIVYDPAKISYERLLGIFWRNVDPLTRDAQFCDHGNQYRSAIFSHDEQQKKLAEASKKALEESKRFPSPIVTEIVPALEFYPRGVPPALLQEKPAAVQVLPAQLRARPAVAAVVGEGGGGPLTPRTGYEGGIFSAPGIVPRE